MKAEWSAFVNENKSGRNPGNLVVVAAGDIQVASLPLALRQFQNVRWDTAARQGLVQPLPETAQEIFRIDVRSKKIFWGGDQEPTTT